MSSVSYSLIFDTQIQKRSHTSSRRHVPDSWWGHQISLTNILTLQVRHSESQYSAACFSSPLIPVDPSLYQTSSNISAGPLRWTTGYTSHINTQPSHMHTPTNHGDMMESQQPWSVTARNIKHGCRLDNKSYVSLSLHLPESRLRSKDTFHSLNFLALVQPVCWWSS